ncbi:MAG: sugar-binding protein, partial [Kribbellaceae bacterium]|nr:sugar-binding protein [Kribbellaceae bacterium]
KGIIKATNAIDSHGYWTIDNWAALTGLTTYRYLATALGETGEAAWAKAQYDDLLRVATDRINQTMAEYKLDYLPISMVEPNETGPRKDPRDANWASMFLFGRWAWDGYLFGAEQTGTMFTKIDDTYTHGFERRAGISDTIYNFGGYPHGYYSSAYNAGYGSAALRGERYRDLGIKAYQFMIDKSMSGPFGWWEGVDYPSPTSPWNIDHAAGGGGSNQHMWGQSTATKVLFDSLIAEKSDGTVIVGRGVPDEWLRGNGQKVALNNYPISGGRLGYQLSVAGKTITIQFTGNTPPTSIELPALRNNIASVSGKPVVDEPAGTIQLPRGTSRVTIVLRHPL